MARLFTVVLMTSIVLIGNDFCFAQGAATKPAERIFQPFQKIRERAANGVIKDAAAKAAENSKLNGQVFKKAAEKRGERAEKKAKGLEIEKRTEEAELKKIEGEAKKAELDAKLAEEQDIEKNKPWDLAEDKESPNELMKIAAEAKEDRDLGPKKQAALAYLAGLGCNKNPDIQKAILAGLKDHDPEIRLAAIQAVLISARGPSPEYISFVAAEKAVHVDEAAKKAAAKAAVENGGIPPEPKPPEAEAGMAQNGQGQCNVCQGKRHKKRFLKKICRGCRGNGCSSCNYCGETMEVYTEPCSACVPQQYTTVPCEPCLACDACGLGNDGCRSCCPSKEIIAELKRIALEPDPERENCNYEPSIDVRNLALEALNVCPPIKEEDKKPVTKPNTGISEEGEKDEKSKGISEESEKSDEADLNNDLNFDAPKMDEELKKPEPDDSIIEPALNSGDDATTQYGTPFQSASYSNARGNLINARLAKYLRGNTYLIELDDDYLIPTGRQLFITNSSGVSQVVNVIGSEVGSVTIAPLEGQLERLQNPTLSVGVLQ